MKTNWDELTATSYYLTLTSIRRKLEEGDLNEVLLGLNEMIGTEYRSIQTGLREELSKIMLYAVCCKQAPSEINAEWLAGLYDARQEIEAYKNCFYFVDNNFIMNEWEKAFERAIEDADSVLQEIPNGLSLTWDDVFEKEYLLPQKRSFAKRGLWSVNKYKRNKG